MVPSIPPKDGQREIHVENGEVSVLFNIPIVSKITYEVLHVYFDMETLNYALATPDQIWYRVRPDNFYCRDTDDG